MHTYPHVRLAVASRRQRGERRGTQGRNASMNSRIRRVAFAASFVLLATLFPAAVAGSPGGPPVSTAQCDVRPNDTFSRLLDCVTVEGVREHQAALQEIADDNDGTRVSGLTGYDELVDYAVEVLEAAGYEVTRQPFDFVRFEVISPAILQQIEPGPITDLPNTIMSYSGNGDVTGAVSTPSGDNRGCTAAEWAGFPAGNIALIQRGTPAGQPPCTFGIKATNAFNAGAIGVVIYNNIAGDLGRDAREHVHARHPRHRDHAKPWRPAGSDAGPRAAVEDRSAARAGNG